MKRAPDRLVIGVTGHRRLGDEGPLGLSIDAVLDEIERRAAESGAKPAGLTVLSPLAEGADRLVARRVLARPGGELEAVLPMSEKKYARDFGAPGSEAEFTELLARARSVRRMRGPRTRSGAYAAAGRWVVDHCDVLLALWDGRPEEGPGGTAEIVRYAKKKGRTVVWIDPAGAVRPRIESRGGRAIS